VLRLSEFFYKKKVFITEEDIEWVAIGFRIVVLLTAIGILFI